MPQDVVTVYKETKNEQVNKPINLYTIFDYNGLGTNLTLAEYKTDVVFDGVTYTKFPISREATSENTQAEIDAIRIKLANVSRLISAYLELYDLRNKKVTIKQVWADKLADTTNVRTETFYIDRYTASDKVVEFECSSKFDVQDVDLPFGRYLRSICRWKAFKDTNCGYVGGFTTCNRTMANCRERANILRFGACPSIPSQRTVLG